MSGLSFRRRFFRLPCKINIIGVRQKGIGELISESIGSLAEEIRPVVLKNIILTGGSSKFPGLFDRLKSEIRQNFYDELEINFLHESSEFFYVEKMATASTSCCKRSRCRRRPVRRRSWRV